MTNHEYIKQANEIDSETRRYLYDQATGVGGLMDKPVPEWIDEIVSEMQEDHDKEYEVGETALRQAALEEAVTALEAFAKDGYYEHF